MLLQPSSVCEYAGLSGPVMELFIAGSVHSGESCFEKICIAQQQ